jgi:hypothetical protein
VVLIRNVSLHRWKTEYIADQHTQCRLSHLHARDYTNGSIRIHDFLDDDTVFDRLYTLSNLDGYYG